MGLENYSLNFFPFGSKNVFGLGEKYTGQRLVGLIIYRRSELCLGQVRSGPISRPGFEHRHAPIENLCPWVAQKITNSSWPNCSIGIHHLNSVQ